MVKTGIAIQRLSPRDVEMMSDDIDISETSNSAKRSCRQNISDGCTMVGTSLIPCGRTRPSSSGRVRSLSDSAMLSSRWEAVMGQPFPRGVAGNHGMRQDSSFGGDAHIDPVVAHLPVHRAQAIFRIPPTAAGGGSRTPPRQ